MGKKNREVGTNAPPPAPASSDETGSVDTDSSSFSEPTPSAPAPVDNALSESETESGSESDDLLVKPKVSKSVSELKKPRSKSNSKPSTSVASTLTKSPARKRPAEAESDDGKLGKKPKKEKGDGVGGSEKKGAKKKGGGGVNKKKQPYQRLWSDGDEIAILEGMIEYAEKKGADPMGDVNDFLGFIKGSLHVDVDRKQLVGKVWRLKKRYENSVGKKKTFTPHEKTTFDLSQKIWAKNHGKGGDIDMGHSSSMQTRTVSKAAKSMASSKGNGVVGSPGKNGWFPPGDNEKKVKDDEAVKMEQEECSEVVGALMGKRCVSMGLDEGIVEAGLSLVGEDKRFEMDEKWRGISVAESQLFYQKIELVQQSCKLIIDAYQASNKKGCLFQFR